MAIHPARRSHDPAGKPAGQCPNRDSGVPHHLTCPPTPSGCHAAVERAADDSGIRDPVHTWGDENSKAYRFSKFIAEWAPVLIGLAGSLRRLPQVAVKLAAKRAAKKQQQRPHHVPYRVKVILFGVCSMVVDRAKGYPGSDGVPIPARPSIQELENLTIKHNVEFAVTYELGPGVNGGGGQYYLYSGDIGSVYVPIQKDMMWIYHTHPRGSAWPSSADRAVLKLMEQKGSPQRVSEVIPVGSGKAIPYDSGPFYMTGG